MAERPYYVYMVRCADGSLYTGVAADWRRRLGEHAARGGRAARYTRAHPVESLAALWEAPDRPTALRLEYRLKRLGAEKKRALAAEPARWRAFVPALADSPIRPAEASWEAQSSAGPQ